MNADESLLADNLRLVPPLWTQTEEDSRTTLNALRDNSEGHVLCIASGGDTALDLLAAGADRVTAIDINPSQVAVTELKARLIEELPRKSFQLFWTGLDSRFRVDVYDRIRSKLSEPARNIIDSWLAEANDLPPIARGKMQGVAEELSIRFPDIAAMASEWFERKTLESQREFYDNKLQRLASIIADLRQSRAEMWFGSGAEADTDNRIAEQMKSRFRQRFDHLAHDILVFNNPYAAHLILGRYPNDAQLLYMTDSGYEAVRSSISRLDLRVGDAIDVLEDMKSGAISGADISNISDLLTRRDTERLFGLLRDRLIKSGTVVHRNLILDEPPGVAAGFSRNLPLSGTLLAQDRSFVYLAVSVDEAHGIGS